MLHNDNPPAGNVNNNPAAAEELHNAFAFAETIRERIEAFEQIMASSFYFKQSELSEYCLTIMNTLLMLPPHNPEEVFCFGKAALNCYVRKIPCYPSEIPIPVNNNARTSHGWPLYIASVCHFLGTACYRLKRYGESLGFLEWADENVITLEEDDDNRCPRNCVRHLSHVTQLQMYSVKVEMGKRDEAVVHMRKALTFKELMMNEGSVELCNAYIEAYEAYVAALDAEQALPLCFKALDICISLYGADSREVALLRVDLGVLYHVRGQKEMANQQNRSWQSSLGSNSLDFQVADIKAAMMLIHFGRYEKAIEVLTNMASSANTVKDGLVSAFGNRASASCILGNFDDAKECVRAITRIFLENDFEPIFAGSIFLKMSIWYEYMRDFDNAITLSRGALEIAEHHQMILPEGLEKLSYQKLFAESTSRLFLLFSRLFSLFSPGWTKEILLFKIVLMKKLEEIFGWEHPEVGYGCARLGVALFNSGQEDLAVAAVALIENAKYIMDVSFGPHHMDSLRTSHTLSEIYVARGRYIGEKVAKGSEGLGPSDKEYVQRLVEY